VINITGNFLTRILELFSTVDTVSAPSMSGTLKLAILSTINILTIISKQTNKPINNRWTSIYISTRSEYVTPAEASIKQNRMCLDWIQLAQNKTQLCTIKKMVVNLQVKQKTVNVWHLNDYHFLKNNYAPWHSWVSYMTCHSIIGGGEI
jgi:hypothetical protein